MIFCASTSCSAAGSTTAGSAAAPAASASGGAGGGAAGAGVASGVARMREMGGRNDDRLGAASPSARFGRGFFSSIHDTVSIAGFVGLGSSGFAASACVSRDLNATAACDLRAASVCDFDLVGAGTGALSGLAGASAFTGLVSFRFDSGAAAALTGLRAVAVLRAAVLVVVLVGIKFTHGRLVRREPSYCAAGVSW